MLGGEDGGDAVLASEACGLLGQGGEGGGVLEQGGGRGRLHVQGRKGGWLYMRDDASDAPSTLYMFHVCDFVCIVPGTLNSHVRASD